MKIAETLRRGFYLFKRKMMPCQTVGTSKFRDRQSMIDEWSAASSAHIPGYQKWENGPIYCPWNGQDKEFMKLYERIKSRTLVQPDRLYFLYKMSQYAAAINGDFAECGVYQGGTAFFLAQQAKAANKKIYLFDSFAGLPSSVNEHDNFHKEGDFYDTNFADVQNFLKEFKENIVFRPGFIPATLKGIEKEKFSFVHVDVDLNQTVIECCEFFYPRLAAGGIMVFDDFGFPSCMGVRKAVEDYFLKVSQPVIVLPTGQAFVIRSR